MLISSRLLVAVALTCSAHGFTAILPPLQKRPVLAPLAATRPQQHGDNHDKDSSQSLRAKLRRAVFPKLVPAVLGALSVAAPFHFPKAAFASAPVMVPVRQEALDPETEAMFDNTKRIEKKNSEEMQAFQKKAQEIARTQGERARREYEKQWEAERQERAVEKAAGLVVLKRELLDQGLDPWTDPEANRQIIMYEKGIDLAEVPGTKYYMEKDFQKNQPKRSMKVQKAPNRFIIKCQVEDMKRKGKDPLAYFEANQQKSADIFNMSNQKAKLLAQQYQENLDKWGQLTEPKEGEIAANAHAKAEQVKADAKETKAKEKEEKAAAKAKAKEEKAAAKAEARRIKEELKKEKAESKKAAAAASAAAAAAAASAAAATSAAAGSAEAAVGSALDAGKDALSPSVVTDDVVQEDDTLGEIAVNGDKSSKTQIGKKKSGSFPVAPAVGAVVAVGGGGFAFKMMREKAERDEEERQRQYKLIMGLSDDDDEEEEDEDMDAELEEFEIDDLPTESDMDAVDEVVSEEGPLLVPEPPKKRRGLGAMFSKKKGNDRETDLNVLISEDATAPEFALVLAKLLTFGAPGRFPYVKALPGGMPMDEFELEAARAQLEESAEAAGITDVEAAEVFANVVNCMLIQIVDLASSTLKEDDKVTVDAINVVVDYMNHAASLYDSVAEGVVITPVTYGGTLGKSKLEQMYSIYAASEMMSMDEAFSARVALLQDVFGISEKRAEGLMMKTMQKKMMNMLKDGGEGMEGMEEMMKAMGGGAGLEGLGGLPGMDGEEPSPEQLKEMLLMLKTMKDSGTIPPEELEAVREQFRGAFGSSIEDVMSDADKDKDDMTEDDKELLDLMKSILDD